MIRAGEMILNGNQHDFWALCGSQLGPWFLSRCPGKRENNEIVEPPAAPAPTASKQSQFAVSKIKIIFYF
ncbi:hypothetical protein DXT99_23355 [Pontibacter diazotrophicus]|uniref:Uncharacterized protein n=1 Tax=Pontibacter diazotrophicus TaxID=1400979 RepID=A0A3D8L4V4_9BACT|nr:hypothetical protein DXT99_23355 [Pontibacter diazotrophicus]